jgi:hypothetical protein
MGFNPKDKNIWGTIDWNRLIEMLRDKVGSWQESVVRNKRLLEIKVNPDTVVACTACKKEFTNREMQYYNDEYGNTNDKIVN